MNFKNLEVVSTNKKLSHTIGDIREELDQFHLDGCSLEEAEEIVRRVNEYDTLKKAIKGHDEVVMNMKAKMYDYMKKIEKLESRNYDLTDMLKGVKEDYKENEFFDSTYVEICKLLEEAGEAE